MKEILKQLLGFFLEALKALDWKSIVYKSMTETVIPMIEKKAKATESKIDDRVVNGVKSLVENFLKPEGKGVSPSVPAEGKK